MTKNVSITAKTINYQDKATGETRTFLAYFVNVMGIEVPIEPQDKTGKSVLEVFFASDKAGK